MHKLFKFLNPLPDAVSTLASLHEQNLDDLKFADEIAATATAKRDGRHAAIVKLTEKVCPETVQAFVDADAAYLTAPSYDEAWRITRDTIQDSIVRNTRKPLLNALDAVMERLGEEMTRTLAAEKKHGAAAGVEVGESDSKVHRALTAKLQDAKNIAGPLRDPSASAYSSFAAIQNGVAFVLNT